MNKKTLVSVLGTLLQLCLSASGATLKPETKEAWDEYLQQAKTAMQARLRPGAHFLWLDDEPERAQYVRIKHLLSGPLVRTFPRKFLPVSFTIGLGWASSRASRSKTF